MDRSSGVFVREATGLVKTLSLRDVVMFNVFFTSFFLALVFVYEDAILEGAGANLVPGILLSTLIIALQVMTYALLSVAMPRSGGDYVWVSRTLHPFLGFIVSWSWVVWLAFWIGFGANTLATIGLSSMLATLGLATSNQALVSASQSVASQTSALVIGTAVIALFAALVVAGMGAYVRVQLAAFVLGVVGTAVGFGYLALMSHSAYVSTFNGVMAPYTSNPDTYHYIVGEAAKQGWTPPTSTISLVGMLSVLPAAFIAIPWVQGSAFIGGEIRNAKRSQILGMLLALLFVGGVTAAIAQILVQKVGLEFLSAFSYLQYNDPSAISGVPLLPYVNSICFVAIANPLLNVLAGIGFVLLGWMYIAQNMINDSRIIFAWSFDRLLPERFASVSQRFHTPVLATLLVSALGWVFLVLVTYEPALSVVSSMFAFNFVMFIVGATALLFPYLKRRLFEASPVAWRVGGVPVISLFGLGTILLNAWAAYNYMVNPVYGVNSPISEELVVAVILTGMAAYALAKLYAKTRGVDTSLAFREIPPE